MRDDALPFARFVAIAGAIATTVALAVVVALAILHAHGLPAGGAPVARPAALPADQPALQTAPQPELAAYRASKRAALERLGWVDAASGVAHLPIEQAMALLARRAAEAPASGASR